MDPYLEAPGLFRDVHANLITSTQHILTALLRPKYVVRIEERAYITNEIDEAAEGRQRVPDIHVTMRESWAQPMTPSAPSIEILEVAEPVVATTWFEEEISETYLKIIDREDREIVAVLEFLSPTNKVPGSAGRKSFEEKRREIMNSKAHWIEIDLLRGIRMVPIPPKLPACEYLVHVSSRKIRPRGALYPISIKARLPVIPIPLREGNADARLDLQAVLNDAYDRAGYDLAVNYHADPPIPLDDHLAEWSRTLLKSKGIV
jgi:hypothetical protein